MIIYVFIYIETPLCFLVLFLHPFPDVPKQPLRSNEEIELDRKIGATLAFIRARETSQTQEEFGKGFGLSQSRLANIESGRTPLPAFIGWDICKTFSVNPVWLARGGESKESRFYYDDLAPNIREVFDAFFKSHAHGPFRTALPTMIWVLKQFAGEHFSLPDEELKLSGKLKVDTRNFAGRVVSVSTDTIPTWKQLVEKLKSLTKNPGAKAQLASDLGTSRQNVNKWLSGTGMPSAELTLAVFRWVKEHE